VCMDGQFICAALPLRYIILNLESGHVTDLFPVEENSPNLAITRIQEQEFLIAGPGNLGMFVTTAGTSVRPPVQWTANLYRIIYSYPYIIGLSPECILVYSISDQKLKQGLPFPGGRTIGAFDGTILLAGSTQISALLPVPWQVQAEKLLEQENVDDVLHLVESISSTPNLTSQSLDKLRIVRQKAGFIFLSRGEMGRAGELLEAGSTDVREILFLYPGLLSSTSQFVPTCPPLHHIPDISSLQLKEGEPTVHQFILDYLNRSVEGEDRYPEHPEEVFTAIAKLEVESEEGRDRFPVFLVQENIVLHYEDLVEFLSSRGLHHFQALVHDKFQNTEEACNI
jgi:hypothetical protein